MRCSKCGTQSPDTTRFCPVCGNKLQSGRGPGGNEGTEEESRPEEPGRHLLDFQGWGASRHGFGRYVEASVYAAVLSAGVVGCLIYGHFWPLYPMLGVLGLVAWLRRL